MFFKYLVTSSQQYPAGLGTCKSMRLANDGAPLVLAIVSTILDPKAIGNEYTMPTASCLAVWICNMQSSHDQQQVFAEANLYIQLTLDNIRLALLMAKQRMGKWADKHGWMHLD